MESTRVKKISRLLQKEVAELLQREQSALTLGTMVSVTQARVSSDLSILKLYVSVFPEARSAEVVQHLQEHASQLRYALGKRVGKQLRVIPEPHVYRDDSLEYIDNIDRLLQS